MVELNISTKENTRIVSSVQLGDGTDTNTKTVYSDENSTRIRIQANPDSTNIIDLAEIQRKRFKALMPNPVAFVNLLHHTVFEDGMSNTAIETVERIYMREPYMTITWLYMVYGANQQNSEVIDGILRILAFLECPVDETVSFIPMLRLALVDENLQCQESAVMLCEVWRTKECLEALKSVIFKDLLLKNYADNIISEISKELLADAS